MLPARTAATLPETHTADISWPWALSLDFFEVLVVCLLAEWTRKVSSVQPQPGLLKVLVGPQLLFCF